jgi:vancomycin permeability regulator SanA
MRKHRVGQNSGVRRLLSYVLWRGGGLVALVVLAAAALIVWDGTHDELGRADLAVVFGNRVEPDGTPSTRLQARLDRALELYRQGWCRFILVSGGLGKEGHNEAVVMQHYLRDHGIPDEHIFLDPDGINTYHTARHTARLMREQGWQGVIAVSQYFHIPRTRLALSRFGIEPVYTAHARLIHWRDGYSIVREVVGWCYYALRPYPSPL